MSPLPWCWNHRQALMHLVFCVGARDPNSSSQDFADWAISQYLSQIKQSLSGSHFIVRMCGCVCPSHSVDVDVRRQLAVIHTACAASGMQAGCQQWEQAPEPSELSSQPKSNSYPFLPFHGREGTECLVHATRIH